MKANSWLSSNGVFVVLYFHMFTLLTKCYSRLHTFELPVNRSCENLNDLCDGVIILFVLNQV